MEKIKVSREVADFIEDYENSLVSLEGWEDGLIIEHSRVWAESFEGAKEEAMCMKDVTPLQLSKILIYGYEVEQTPEERLANAYSIKGISDYNRGFRTAIKYTLDTLGLKIEGINDNDD